MMIKSKQQGFSCPGFLFILFALLFAMGFLLLCTGFLPITAFL